jgi:LPXTG-motif cell wall-anchored protein
MATMVLALLLICTASGALAAIPSTADDRNATQPLITGRVLMVSEHDMVVSTEQGNEVPLTLDTRTMVPADLSRDMMVRVEFHYLDDGTRYAKRIIPIRHGQRLTRELAYSRERDDDEAEVRYAAAYVSGEPRPSRVASVTNQRLDRAITPIPSTDEYHVATQAMVVGRVISVTDHRIVVDTDQHERVALEMDSRTLVPTDLRSGIGVRIEYRAVDNGARLATRVVPIRYDRMGQGLVEEEASSPQEDFDATSIDASTAEYRGDADDDEAVVAQANDTENAGDGDRDADDVERGALPQTSSNEPLLVLLGLLALGTGAAVLLRRNSQLG